MSFSNNFPTTGPSLELDFANVGALDPRITFTRSSIATVTNSLGLLQTVQANVPRFDYDPVTLAPRGLLIEEQRTNLLTYSEYLTNAAWSTAGGAATVSGNVAVAPDGTTTADKIVSTVATSYGVKTPIFTSTAAEYTQSAFCKADGFNYVKFVWSSAQNATNYAVFNLTNGTVTGGVYTSASITPFGNGWYRCSITSTLAAVSTSSNIWMSDGTLIRSSGVAGDGTSGILVWGAQLEAGAFPTSYVPSTQTFTGRTSTGTFIGSNGLIQTAGVGVARQQYNPLNLSVAPFLLLEAAATNFLVRSEDFGNSAWNNATPDLPTITANTTVAPDGTTTADTLTAATGGTASQARQITASTGTTGNFTGSVYLKAGTSSRSRLALVDSTSGFNTVGNFSIAWTAGVASVLTVTSGTASVFDAGNGWYRCVITANVPSANANVSFSIYPDALAGTNSVIAWGAQLEAGSFATSYIPTVATTGNRSADTSTSAATQRNRDEAVMTGAAFSSWYNATEGTLFSDGGGQNYVSSARIASISDGTFNNRICTLLNSQTSIGGLITAGGSSQANITGSVASSASSNKIAIGYAANNVNIAVNGAIGTLDPAASMPPVNLLRIGSSEVGTTSFLCGFIRKISYYPVRLADAQLQALTL